MNKKQICLSFLCGIAGCLSSLHAGDYTWMAEPQSGIWSTNQVNWGAGEVWPESDGHTAIFGVSTQKQITVSEALDIGGLSFQVDGYHVDGEKLVFSGATPSISVGPAGGSALLETPLQNDSQITKSGAGELRLGAAAYNGDTNVNNMVVSEGTLTLEGGRTLCSTGVLSVAAGATYNQSGGINHLLSGGNVFVIGQGGDTTQTARVDVTGGTFLAPALAHNAGANAYFILGQDRDAYMRIAETGDVRVLVIEMNPDLTPDRSSTLQLDGGCLTVTRITGTAGKSNTVSRVLLNGGEIRAGGWNNRFLGDMTEVLVQSGGVTLTIPSAASFFKTTQSLLHDPALGEALDGGLTKLGTSSLHLQGNSTYNGGTRIDQGLLYVQNNDALGTGPVTIGTVGSNAVLVGESDEIIITNAITLGHHGSVCAIKDATLTLTDIAFSLDYEQIKAGGAEEENGTVKLLLEPEKPAHIFNLFVYDQQTLVLDGGTVIQQVDPLPEFTTRVEIRAGSQLAVHDADIQMPDITYLNLAGGEYWQTAGTALFPQVRALIDGHNSAQPELPARIVLDGGTLTFTETDLFSAVNRRGSEMIINGGTLRAKTLNLSKSVQQPSVSHAVELNGGTLEVEAIRYDGGYNAVEEATVLLNGGTLKVATASTATNHFISAGGFNLFSVYLGGGGFICDTAEQNILIDQPLEIDPGLGAATDGGFIKRGAGSLTLSSPLASSGPIVVEEGTLCFAEACLSGETIEVQAGGVLELYRGGISNTTITVAAGATLRLAQAAATVVVPNGSLEINELDALTHQYLTEGQPDVAGWSFIPSTPNQVGIQKNGSAFSTSGPFTTNGTTTLLLKEGMVKTMVSVPKAGLYHLAFEHSMRYGHSSWLRYVDVTVDGENVYTIKNPVNVQHGYEPVTVLVELTQGIHEIAFTGQYATSKHATILIDAVTLTGIGTESIRFDSEATECDFRAIEKETTFEVPNGSFETYASDSFSSKLYQYYPTGTGWRYTPGTLCGIQSNSSPFSLTPEFYTTNGVITAFIKEGTIETDFVAYNGNYKLCFEHATRSNNDSWDRRVEVKIDGVTLYTVEHNEQYHGFWPVEIPVYLEAGKHTLSFVGLHSSVNNQNATVLLDAIKLKRNNVNRSPGDSILNLTTGSTVVLDNTTPLYLEYIYVDGKRLRGALRAGMSGGATVLGGGTLNTVAGGAVILIR